ncbi:MAG: hypothetical protein DMF67_18095 [Acidobacteria bacterium]|nr:MAG: hypothetical protein DMF67_18095 [Acidobacteriota bacterium]
MTCATSLKRAAGSLDMSTTVTPGKPRSPSVTRPATVAGTSLCAEVCAKVRAGPCAAAQETSAAATASAARAFEKNRPALDGGGVDGSRVSMFD